MNSKEKYTSEFVCFVLFFFFNPEGQGATEISECILKELKVFDTDAARNKIIAQTYDGASVMRGLVNGVQSKIK